jgi:hypothetical protein
MFYFLKKESKMKNLKVMMMTLMMCLMVMVSFGQDRVNREKLSFLDESNKMTTAVGWSYNTTLGEWVDYSNVIENDKTYKDKYKSLQGSYMMSHRSQNFISIQTKTLVYKDNKYFVLLVEKWNGYYEYPSIFEDWTEYKAMYGYIFSETEYNKLLNINGVLNLETQYMVSMGSSYEKYDEVVLLDKIQTNLSSEKSKYSSTETFPIIKTESGDIRFYVPSYFTSYSKFDFDKEYFETTFDNFNRFIIK